MGRIRLPYATVEAVLVNHRHVLTVGRKLWKTVAKPSYGAEKHKKLGKKYRLIDTIKLSRQG